MTGSPHASLCHHGVDTMKSSSLGGPRCPGFPVSTATRLLLISQALYDKVFTQRGNVPNMFRVMAHRPEIFATMQAHFAAVLNTGTVSTKLKELIIVRTSQVNETPYCLASHTTLALNLGWTDDQLAHLADWPNRDDFSPAEKAALRLAETVTRDAHAVTDEQFVELRSFYLRRRNRRVALRNRAVQLLQPIQQRSANGAHEAW